MNQQNLESNKGERNLFRLIVVFYLLIIAGSIYYYLERISFMDGTYHLFAMILNNGFSFNSNRFGAFFTQLSPVLGLKMGLSLKSLGIIHSISFPLFYFLSFLFTWIVLKNRKMAVVIFLYNILMVTHSFFWIPLEFLQGTVFALVYFAIVEWFFSNEKNKIWLYILSPFFIITIIFYYPLMIFVFLFGMIHLYFQFPKMKVALLVFSIIGILTYYLKSKYFVSSHENESNRMIANFRQLFPTGILTYPSLKHFVKWMIKDYYLVVICYILLTGFYLYHRRYIKWLVLSAFFVGLSFAISINYFEGYAQQFYLEQPYMILSFFVALFCVYEFYDLLREKRVMIALSIFFLFFIVRIEMVAPAYEARLSWYERMIDNAPDKIILSEKEVPMDIIQQSWASSHETWLISTIKYNRSKSMIIEFVPNEFDASMDYRNVFITKWATLKYTDLNQKYFRFNDTMSPYKYFHYESKETN